MNLSLGIDPGVNGAIVAIKDTTSVDAYRIPVKYKDIKSLLSMIVGTNSSSTFCVLEHIGLWVSDRKVHGKVIHISKLLRNAILIEVALIELEVETEIVFPMSWQRVYKQMFLKSSNHTSNHWKHKRKKVLREAAKTFIDKEIGYESFVCFNDDRKEIKPNVTLMNCDAILLAINALSHNSK